MATRRHSGRRRTPAALYSVMAYLARLSEQVLPSMVDQLRTDPPDYLLIDSMCLWGHLARQVVPLPAVTLASVFVPDDAHVTADEMVRLAYGRAPKEVTLAGIAALDEYLGITQRIDRRFGTDSPDIVRFFSGRQALNILFTSRDFHPAGDTYDASYRFVGPSIAPRGEAAGAGVPSADGAPLVYVSMGTIFNDQPAFYRACLDALGARPVRVLVLTGGGIDPTIFEDVPPNVTIRDHVSQLEVLERAALFITHGGMNSVSEALWFGVPLVVFPQHGDQHLVAARVADRRAGIVITPGDLDAARLGDIVDRVLAGGEYRAGAAAVSRGFRQAGGPARAADEILSFAASAAAEGGR